MVCAQTIDIGFNADKIVGFVDGIAQGEFDEFVIKKGNASVAVAFVELVKPFAAQRDGGKVCGQPGETAVEGRVNELLVLPIAVVVGMADVDFVEQFTKTRGYGYGPCGREVDLRF